MPNGERATDTFIKKWGDRISKLGELAGIKDESDEPLYPTSYWMTHSFLAVVLR